MQTIESCAREFLGNDTSSILTATVVWPLKLCSVQSPVL